MLTIHHSSLDNWDQEIRRGWSIKYPMIISRIRYWKPFKAQLIDDTFQSSFFLIHQKYLTSRCRTRQGWSPQGCWSRIERRHPSPRNTRTAWCRRASCPSSSCLSARRRWGTPRWWGASGWSRGCPCGAPGPGTRGRSHRSAGTRADLTTVQEMMTVGWSFMHRCRCK